MRTLINAENLAHNFDYPLFRGVNLNVAAGESAAVMGVSGSGKSTLLHILSSFLAPREGRVALMDCADIYAEKPSVIGKIRRNAIGLIFQQHYLFRGFSALDNLKVASLLSGEAIEAALLERLGISQVLEQDAMSLSGGQQQRLSIARVLTKKPKLLFADEPTGNLDQGNAAEVAALLFDYAREAEGAFFLVTHDENLARKADRFYRLENGELVLQ
ncbi:MAG: ATP-binding cassette domain-containing protein [Helicobacteraceae bacterium]|jgi:putative ABC transport system ATP-binding protein|nr:ATP-binding cassette domain-containing protein [Helicobacteraceae bacterium]